MEARSRRPFHPVGFNYGHDGRLNLLEETWHHDWRRVENDLRRARDLGATVVRIHLQLGRFLPSPERPDRAELDRLGALLELAERLRLRLLITGLGAYRREAVPPWYDALPEPERWAVQARFWREVAAVGARHGSVFAYDLMNEPVAPSAPAPAGDWLPGEPFAGFHYVQRVSLDPAGREPEQIAIAWTRRMVRAVRSRDADALLTVGLVPWSVGDEGLQSGFRPRRLAPLLDFVSVHVYPRAGALDEALETLRAFRVEGRPLVVEETYPLYASVAEMERFRRAGSPLVAGWIGGLHPVPWPCPRAALRDLAEGVQAEERSSK